MRAAIDEYAARIRHYVKFDEAEIEDAAPAPLEVAIDRAAKAAVLVPLDASGTEHDSRGFSRLLERLGSHGKGEFAFVIGGRAGLPSPMLQRAGEVLSLSKMTLPHRLARLVLCEQIYRGLTLLRGEPYGAP